MHRLEDFFALNLDPHARAKSSPFATEVGIEPTARHAADLCFIPVIIADACGAGDETAAQRSLEALRFAGDAIISDTETFTDLLKQA